MSRDSLSPARLEAFSDGVIAVIITILVLELKVPTQDGWAGLRAVWPTLFLYLLTFVQVGIYWVNHHYLTDEAESVSHAVLWANLIFLFCLSLFPFATLWVGTKGLSHFSTALYAFVSLLPGISYASLSRQVRKQSAAPPHSSVAKQVTSITLYLIAVPAAYVHAALSLAMVIIYLTHKACRRTLESWTRPIHFKRQSSTSLILTAAFNMRSTYAGPTV